MHQYSTCLSQLFLVALHWISVQCQNIILEAFAPCRRKHGVTLKRPTNIKLNICFQWLHWKQIPDPGPYISQYMNIFQNSDITYCKSMVHCGNGGKCSISISWEVTWGGCRADKKCIAKEKGLWHKSWYKPPKINNENDILQCYGTIYWAGAGTSWSLVVTVVDRHQNFQ